MKYFTPKKFHEILHHYAPCIGGIEDNNNLNQSKLESTKNAGGVFDRTFSRT